MIDKVWPRCKCGHIAQDHNKPTHYRIGDQINYSCDIPYCSCQAYRFPAPVELREALLAQRARVTEDKTHLSQFKSTVRVTKKVSGTISAPQLRHAFGFPTDAKISVLAPSDCSGERLYIGDAADIESIFVEWEEVGDENPTKG